MTNYGRGRSCEKVHLESPGNRHWGACGSYAERAVSADAAVAITCKRCLKFLAKVAAREAARASRSAWQPGDAVLTDDGPLYPA
jgi:hypothetical protein